MTFGEELGARLTKSDPGEGLPLVASLCHDLAWDLLDEGLLSDAEALVREELVAVRFLATYDPETFLPNVADACENLAGVLWGRGASRGGRAAATRSP